MAPPAGPASGTATAEFDVPKSMAQKLGEVLMT
jgi:hypothetical protein